MKKLAEYIIVLIIPTLFFSGQPALTVEAQVLWPKPRTKVMEVARTPLQKENVELKAIIQVNQDSINKVTEELREYMKPKVVYKYKYKIKEVPYPVYIQVMSADTSDNNDFEPEVIIKRDTIKIYLKDTVRDNRNIFQRLINKKPKQTKTKLS